MNNLFDLQNQFQNYLFNDNENFKKNVVSTEKVSAEARLLIYKNAYIYRLIDALQSNYPLFYDFVGTEIFESLAKEYIQEFPSTERSIRWFGHRYASFLKSHEEYQDHPYLVELAEFEWAHTIAFDAADDKVLLIEEIQNISPELWQHMRFRAHPSVQRLNFFWNTVQLWQALADDTALDDPHENIAIVPWILWRREYTNQFYSLAPDEALSLDAILNGKTFGEMCEILCVNLDEEEAVVRAATLISNWIQSEILSEIII